LTLRLPSRLTAAFQNEELKSLTRYRFKKMPQRAKLKQSLSRLVNILFPELLHLNCIYSMLLKSAKDIAKSRFDIFANLIETTLVSSTSSKLKIFATLPEKLPLYPESVSEWRR